MHCQNTVIGYDLKKTPGGGVLAACMTMGGPTELHIENPKIYMSLKFYAQKITGIKIFYPKKYKTKYLNTELFNQTDLIKT